LAVHAKVKGETHSDVFNTRDFEIRAFGGLGRADDATKKARKLLPEMERTLGTDHSDAVSVSNLLTRLLGSRNPVIHI
jgi:hypothetical protein